MHLKEGRKKGLLLCSLFSQPTCRRRPRPTALLFLSIIRLERLTENRRHRLFTSLKMFSESTDKLIELFQRRPLVRVHRSRSDLAGCKYRSVNLTVAAWYLVDQRPWHTHAQAHDTYAHEHGPRIIWAVERKNVERVQRGVFINCAPTRPGMLWMLWVLPELAPTEASGIAGAEIRSLWKQLSQLLESYMTIFLLDWACLPCGLKWVYVRASPSLSLSLLFSLILNTFVCIVSVVQNKNIHAHLSSRF